MDINIAICDDEVSQIEYLSMTLKKWANIHNISLHIYTYQSAESFLFMYEEDNGIDILLLDVQMKELNGINLARKIRENNDILQIVFITGYPDFIAEGYDVSALHYLLKPVNEEKLFVVLNKAITKISSSKRTIVFNKTSGNIRIYADEIIYAEIISHTITLYLTNKKENINMRISDMEMLLGDGFMRCHRSFIVSIKHINRISKSEILLDNGTTIPLSQNYYDKANRLFIEYN